MTRFSIDLPFLMSLNEDDYPLRIADREFRIQHSFIQRDSFDPRIGGISAGSFGFERDPLGAVRYSRLVVDGTDEALDYAGTSLSGRASIFLEAGDFPRIARERAEVALAIINRFLDKYRIATRSVDVRPIVPPWDLALLRFDDGQNSGEFRLYGGGITLPVAGLSLEYQQKVLNKLAEPEPSTTFELAAVDAMRAVEDGLTLEAIVTGVGALEAAVDLYLSRTWRLSQPRVLPQDALTRLGIKSRNAPRVFTIEDVLETGGVRAKVTAYATATGKSNDLQSMYDAIELRNLAVHGGVRVPVGRARPHVERIAEFVLDEVTPRIGFECPSLPRAELLYACEESLGNQCSPNLEKIVASYLTGRGLTAKLYNQRHNRQEMSSERFEDTLLIRITFGDFGPDQINLFIAQALLYHYLERRGDIARARPDDDPSEAFRRPFFEVVASAMTRAVWNAAINRRLRHLGFNQLVQEEAERRARKLRSKYRGLHAEARFEELGFWVDYLDLAWVAAELLPTDRTSLLTAVERTAPQTVARARAAIGALEQVEFDDPESIREALIRVHDAHGSILASASIFDPVTQKRYGFGLRLEDLGVQILRQSSPVDSK